MEDYWKEEYNIGSQQIDDAHKKLFGILQKVVALTREKDFEKNRHACVEALKFLCNYTTTHFAEEEAYMVKVGFPELERHKKIHDSIMNVIIPNYNESLEKSNFSTEAVNSFVEFFKKWLTNHILIEDHKIKDYLSK